MKDARFDIDAENVRSCRDIDHLLNLARVVECDKAHGSTEYENTFSLGGTEMSMRSNECPRLHGVEHSVQRRIGRFMEWQDHS